MGTVSPVWQSKQLIMPCLWFNTQAEEAARFYTSVFKNSHISQIAYYGKEASHSGMPEGSVLTVSFTLDGQEFLALNGGPAFTHSPAISFMIACDSQEEIDFYWDKLTADGGQPSQCGWLTDKFGLSWQVYPRQAPEWIGDGTSEGSERYMAAMMQMNKLNYSALEKAYRGE